MLSLYKSVKRGRFYRLQGKTPNPSSEPHCKFWEFLRFRVVFRVSKAWSFRVPFFRVFAFGDQAGGPCCEEPGACAGSPGLPVTGQGLGFRGLGL